MNFENLIKMMVAAGASNEEVESAIKEIRSGSNPIRRFTEEESNIYGNAALTATFMMPAFRDAVALLRPFYDATCESSYVDPHARAGFGPAFFLKSQTKEQRATFILHEAMHVLYGHFSRGDALSVNGILGNLAGDFEINSTLSQIPKADTSLDVFPNKEPYDFPMFKSFEQYVQLLKDFANDQKENGKGDSQQSNESDSDENESQDSESSNSSQNSESSENQDSENDSSSSSESSNDDSSDDSSESSENGSSSGGSSSGSDNDSESDGTSGGSLSDEIDNIRNEIEKAGNQSNDGKRSCAPLTKDRSERADELGVEKASTTEQSVVKDNTVAMIREEAKKSLSAGDSGMHSVLKIAEMALQPPKVKWQTMFKQLIGRASDQIVKGKSDYSYRRPNRRTASGKFVHKGMITYEASALFGFDTSGSMSKKDYENQLSEIETLVKKFFRGKNRFKAFPVTTTIGEVQPVSSVKNVNITGGGGTDMSVAFKYVNSLPDREKPDVFILSTDGGTDFQSIEREIRKMKLAYPPIILITSEYGMENVPDHLKNSQICKILDIS